MITYFSRPESWAVRTRKYRAWKGLKSELFKEHVSCPGVCLLWLFGLGMFTTHMSLLSKNSVSEKIMLCGYEKMFSRVTSGHSWVLTCEQSYFRETKCGPPHHHGNVKLGLPKMEDKYILTESHYLFIVLFIFLITMINICLRTDQRCHIYKVLYVTLQSCVL